MQPFESVEDVLAGTGRWYTPGRGELLAEHPLSCIETEYPHWQREIEDPDEVTPPSERHPVFYGCYDWHSAVHSHWCLVRQLRLFDDHPNEEAIRESIDERLTAENVAEELAYFEDNPSFENPYGWAWYCKLVGELERWDDQQGARWVETLEPLTTHLIGRIESNFLDIEEPFRVGTHANTAFALTWLLEFARLTGRTDLASSITTTAERLYGADTAYPIEYEPLGWDFISPALVEADLMRRVLDETAFQDWLADFLPDLASDPDGTLPEPIDVDAEESGLELHFVGLNLANAWCLRDLADAVHDEPVRAVLEDRAHAHATVGLEHAFTDDYAGAHWLSSFVLYLGTRHLD